MQKIVLGLIALAFVAVIGIGGYMILAGADQEAPSMPDSTRKTDTQQSVDQTSSGSFVDYSDAAFAQATDKNRVLFFHASWCPQCRSIEKNINAATIPANLAIFKVDFDRSQDLRRKYGVTIQTTFVYVDEQGNELKQWNWYDAPDSSVEDIEREISDV